MRLQTTIIHVSCAYFLSQPLAPLSTHTLQAVDWKWKVLADSSVRVCHGDYSCLEYWTQTVLVYYQDQALLCLSISLNCEHCTTKHLPPSRVAISQEIRLNISLLNQTYTHTHTHTHTHIENLESIIYT